MACSQCGGVGKILVDDHTVRPCVCLLRAINRDHLGPDLWSAPYIKVSPLFELDQSGVPCVDLTERNVFIKSSWQTLRPHLKLALGCKHNLMPSHRWRQVTDEKLLRVWLGTESYTAKPKRLRDQQEVNNSLVDLIGPEISLVLVLIGRLGHKNVAMPGILKEALMLRETHRKPTWIVEEPEYGFFGPGHLAYGDDVAEYIEHHFDVLDLREESGPSPMPPENPTSLEPEDISLDTPPEREPIPQPQLNAPERFTVKEDGLDESALGALGEGKTKKFKYRPRGRHQ